MRFSIITILLLCQLSILAQENDSLLFKQARDAYFSGNTNKALELLDSDPAIAEGNQRIAYYLNAATAHSTLGNFEQSNKLFDIAYQIIEDSSKNTGSKAIAYLMNPLATQYEGESAEQMLIHYFKVQNYLSLGDGQSATKEVEKLGARIESVKEIYKDAHRYKGETLYHQLAGIVAEYNGDPTLALESYLKAYELYGAYTLPNFDVDAPWQLKADIVRLSTGEEQSSWANLFDIDPSTIVKKGNEVIVFWHNGKSPHKNSNLLNLKITAQGMDVKALDSKTGETFPVAMAAGMQAASKMLAGGTDVNLKFARYQNYEPKYDSAKIGSVYIEPMENLTNVLNQSLTDRKARDINSMMGRHLAKSVLKNKAKQKMGGLVNRIPGAGIVGADKMVNKAIDNAIDNTEKADWRQWDMLPHTISYARIYLPQGEQDININYTSQEGTQETKTTKFNVKNGTNVLVLTSFQAEESEEQETPANVTALASTAAMMAIGNKAAKTGNINSIEVAAPNKYPTGGTEAIYTEYAGEKLENNQYTEIVGNPEDVMTEGTVTITFRREGRFPASAVAMVVVINGEDQLEVKNGQTETLEIEATGQPLVMNIRNKIVKNEDNNILNNWQRILYYPTKPEVTFVIDGKEFMTRKRFHRSMTHESLWKTFQ